MMRSESVILRCEKLVSERKRLIISVCVGFLFTALCVSSAFAAPKAGVERLQSAHSQEILAAAKASVGKEMWKGFGLPNGGLGCAASLSNVLGKAGVKYARSPVTKVVRQKLLGGPVKTAEYVVKEGGDGPINDRALANVAKPGDVLVAFMDPLPKGNIGPKAHCGIIGPDGTVFTNDWNDGIWKHADIHTYFDSYRHIRVIRLR